MALNQARAHEWVCFVKIYTSCVCKIQEQNQISFKHFSAGVGT